MEDQADAKPLTMVAEAFKELAAIANSQCGDIEVASFSRACSFLTPIFDALGVAFLYAERDYVIKVGDLTEASKSIATLPAMLARDIEGNCVKKSGSHSRNLLRVRRVLDMFRVLFEEIQASEGNSLKDAVSKAYEAVFASGHNWAYKKAVAAGLYALPTKEELLKKLNEEETSAKIQMQNFVVASVSVGTYIDNLFRSRGLDTDW